MSDVDLPGTNRQRFPLLHLVRTYGWNNLHYLLLAIVLKTIATLVSLADVFVIGLAFDALFNDEPYLIPLFPQSWIPTDPIAQVWFTASLLFLIKTTDILGTVLSQTGFHIFTQRLIHDLRINTFDTAQQLELGFFDQRETGDIMSVFNNDVNNLEKFLSGGMDFVLWVIVSLVSAFLYMFYLNWQLALLVLAAGPIIYGTNAWFATVLERCQDQVRERVGALNTQIETALSGMDVVKAFNSQQYESDRVEESSYDHFLARWDNRRIAVRQRPTYRLITGSVLVLVIIVGGYWVFAGPPLIFTEPLTAGTLIPFLFYLQRINMPMKQLGEVNELYKSAKASSKRIEAISSSDRSFEDKGNQSLKDVAGRVEYENVTFSYPGSDKPVINNVSFRCEPGDTVGLVGSTGAGKSTLIKLLLRFYDVDSGAVCVDGRDVRKVPLSDLRDAIGYVDQETFMFSGTIHKNIAYGVDDADDEDIEWAAREAGAHEFITELPDGYETEVGERGTKLSGGQRQRLAVARALIADAPILILDEATSHIDNRTEATIQNNLDTLTQDRTTFIVAHRLSTVRKADTILVLDNGEIVESGDHESLIEQNGVYADLWNIQIGHTEGYSNELITDMSDK